MIILLILGIDYYSTRGIFKVVLLIGNVILIGVNELCLKQSNIVSGRHGLL